MPFNLELPKKFKFLTTQANQVAQEMDDRFSLAVTSVQRGRIDEDLGRHEDAIPRFDFAIEIFKELGARWEMADAIAERGICHRDLGRLDEGERDLRKAMQISQELGEQQIAGWTGRAACSGSCRRSRWTPRRSRRRRHREPGCPARA